MPPDPAPSSHSIWYWPIERADGARAGSGGIVYRAWDPRLNRTVAIKMLRQRLTDADDASDRLRREARSVAALSHPNILALYEIGQTDGDQPYLVFEFIDGQSLEQILAERKILPARQAARWARDVALGLQAAHDAGLIHRDVKPSNIIIQRDTGTPKLVDFGLAIDDAFQSRLTQDGVITGTPAYMSPEQVQPDHPIDARTDVYSLGVVLYESLTGEVPFRGIVKSTLDRIVHESPPDPRKLNPDIPRDLATIALKAMAKEPHRRYATAGAMAQDLDRWLQHLPILARPVSRGERMFNWCRRNPLSACLVSLVGLLTGALIVGSLVAASRMHAANQRVTRSLKQLEEKSRAVQQQRDALLESMQNLIYRINGTLEQDVVDLNQVQEQLLRVAIDGLKVVSQQADSHLSRQSAADAHFRLATVLYRLDDLPQANRHLELARSINRQAMQQQSDPSDGTLLELRLDWLQAMLDSERELPQPPLDEFRNVWTATDAAIAQDRWTPGLLADAMAGLGLLADAQVEQDAIDSARRCWQAIVHYADLILGDDPANLLETIRDHLHVCVMKIDAQNALAELEWQTGDDLRAVRIDWSSHAHGLLVDLLVEMGLESQPPDPDIPLADQAVEYLEEAIASFDQLPRRDTTDRLLLAGDWAKLCEVQLIRNDPVAALEAARQAVQSLEPIDDSEPETLEAWVANGQRAVMLLIQMDRTAEAEKELDAMRKTLRQMDFEPDVDGETDQLARWLTQLDLLQSMQTGTAPDSPIPPRRDQ